MRRRVSFTVFNKKNPNKNKNLQGERTQMISARRHLLIRTQSFSTNNQLFFHFQFGCSDAGNPGSGSDPKECPERPIHTPKEKHNS